MAGAMCVMVLLRRDTEQSEERPAPDTCGPTVTTVGLVMPIGGTTVDGCGLLDTVAFGWLRHGGRIEMVGVRTEDVGAN